MSIFETKTAWYIDYNGNRSLMKWIPPFVACRALSATAAVATPSGTVGDFFHPRLVRSSWVEGTDYEYLGKTQVLTSGTLTVGKHYRIATYVSDDDFTNVGCPQNVQGQCFVATGTTPTVWTNSSVLIEEELGGFWVDMYLCASYDATPTNMGTVCSGDYDAYVSIPGVAPRVNQRIAHFRQFLKQRFNYGCFDFELDYGASNPTTITKYAGKGGLITDAHWFELWIWTRINRWLLRGNTNGYNASNHIPQWHLDTNDIGILDPTVSSTYGASITGGGSPLWEIPISDFCGNRWEFTDGLRLYNGTIYTAGKTVNPFTSPSDDYSHASFTNTGLAISGVKNSQSIASYRTESALKRHGIPASTTTAGSGGFDGQGWWHNSSGERVALRGGGCHIGALCPGALYLSDAPSLAGWLLGARAVLVP